MVSRPARSVVLAVAYAVLSLYITALMVIGSGFTGGTLAADTNHLLDGTARRPFAYRALVPAVARLLVDITPDAMQNAVSGWLEAFRDNSGVVGVIRQHNPYPHPAPRASESIIRHPYSAPPGSGEAPRNGGGAADVKPYDPSIPPTLDDAHIYGFGVFIVLIFAGLLGAVTVQYKFAALLWPAEPLAAAVAPLVLLLALPAFATHFAYIYDPAEMFFSGLCLYFLYQQRWAAYLAAIALATCNKETSIFCIFLYFIWCYGRLPMRDYVRLGALQLAIYAVVKGAITVHFASAPGRFLAFWRIRHLYYLLGGYNYYTVIGLAVTVLLLTYRWQEKPPFLRACLWMLVPNTVAYVLFCMPGEYRSFYFSLPAAVLLATDTLMRWTGAGTRRP